ncbi:EthD domain-containing protein [Sphingobium faniae]|nr:EthD domain-containing protein [Sphingobium faniae]
MKVIILLKRKPGLSFEQFKAHYEASHVQLAHKYMGHLFTEYRRNYTVPFSEHHGDDPNPGFADSPYDCVTEIRLTDHAAWEEMQRIAGDPVIGPILQEDEERFMDRSALKIFEVAEIYSPQQVLTG